MTTRRTAHIKSRFGFQVKSLSMTSGLLPVCFTCFSQYPTPHADELPDLAAQCQPVGHPCLHNTYQELSPLYTSMRGSGRSFFYSRKPVGKDPETYNRKLNSPGIELIKGHNEEIGGRLTLKNNNGTKINVEFMHDSLLRSSSNSHLIMVKKEKEVLL